MDAVPATTVITALTIAAGLALVIERTIELLKHFMGSASNTLGKGELKELLQRAAEAVREAKDALDGKGTIAQRDFSTFSSPPARAAVVAASLPLAADGEASERHPAPSIPVIPPTALSVQETGRQLFYLFFAAGAGIVLAEIFGIGLVALLMSGNGVAGAASPLYQQLDTIFSGVVIGGGSQPIHAVIRFLTERAVTKQVLSEGSAPTPGDSKDLGTLLTAGKLVAERKEPAPLQWQEIVYAGGVNPAALQATHLRPADPHLVVYHHTAMASSKSFQEIVDEFLLNKRWLTGYHCVIMPDGAIKPFCRWDRTGNHAMGHNAHSLGLSFHGNFHTDPNDKYSNADGRYGNQQPTEAQLHAGARVVALWCHLYPQIKLDFEQHIVPHHVLVPGHTVCPGSNFRHEEFKALVRQYHQAWAASPEAQQRLTAFKKLDYLYG